MSLVEKALKKMAESARASNVSPERPFGIVVPTGQHRPLDTPARARPHVSDRIVEINQDALRAAGLLPPAHQEQALAHQYRQIKRPLVANAIGRGTAPLPNGHLVMMASAMPGEGKTFTSINLAFSLAREKDIHVLLVDADVAKPHISKLFGVTTEAGLLDALQKEALDVETAILPTSVPGLSVLPAGKGADNATELLASTRMRDIVRLLGERDANRIVLFDSPPLLLTTESHALADVVGQIVVVVRAGSTPRPVVMDALSFLGERPGVSMVLNQIVTRTDTGYYYHYGYDEKSAHAT